RKRALAAVLHCDDLPADVVFRQTCLQAWLRGDRLKAPWFTLSVGAVARLEKPERTCSEARGGGRLGAQMDLPADSVELIRQWAARTNSVREVWLFGSRAKGIKIYHGHHWQRQPTEA